MTAGGKRESLVFNGEFRQGQQGMDFPDGWIRIFGHRETSWEWCRGLPEPSQIVIRQSSGGRAGIIQTAEAIIYTGGARGWEVCVSLSRDQLPVDAFICLYPCTEPGQFTVPWQFFFNPGRSPQLFEQSFYVPVNTEALRLEVGLVGHGTLLISRIAMFRLES